MINYDMLPEHMVGAAKRYVEQGVMPGDFLHAVLANDLVKSFAYADDINRASMWEWVGWLFNEAPSECWGSLKKVDEWFACKGLIGVDNEREECAVPGDGE